MNCSVSDAVASEIPRSRLSGAGCPAVAAGWLFGVRVSGWIHRRSAGSGFWVAGLLGAVWVRPGCWMAGSLGRWVARCRSGGWVAQRLLQLNNTPSGGASSPVHGGCPPSKHSSILFSPRRLSRPGGLQSDSPAGTPAWRRRRAIRFGAFGAVMTYKSVILTCCAAVTLVVAVTAQTPSQPPTASGRPAAAAPAPARTQAPAPAPSAAAAASQANQPATTAAQEKALLDTYCLACHSERAKATMDSARKLTIDAPRREQPAQGPQDVGTDRPQAAGGHDAAARIAASRSRRSTSR